MKVEPNPITSHFSSCEIDLYIDGELSSAGSSGLEEHLPSCRDCRARLRDRQVLHLTIGSSIADALLIPAGFAQRTAEMASNGWSAMGRLPLAGKNIIGLWFLALVAAFAGNTLTVTSSSVVAKITLLPSELTAMATSVSFVFSGLESIALVLLRYFF